MYDGCFLQYSVVAVVLIDRGYKVCLLIIPIVSDAKSDSCHPDTLTRFPAYRWSNHRLSATLMVQQTQPPRGQRPRTRGGRCARSGGTVCRAPRRSHYAPPGANATLCIATARPFSAGSHSSARDCIARGVCVAGRRVARVQVHPVAWLGVVRLSGLVGSRSHSGLGDVETVRQLLECRSSPWKSLLRWPPIEASEARRP